MIPDYIDQIIFSTFINPKIGEIFQCICVYNTETKKYGKRVYNGLMAWVALIDLKGNLLAQLIKI